MQIRDNPHAEYVNAARPATARNSVPYCRPRADMSRLTSEHIPARERAYCGPDVSISALKPAVISGFETKKRETQSIKVMPSGFPISQKIQEQITRVKK